jgi:hypothetical protein
VYYDSRTYDQAELAGVMRQTYEELIAFVTSPEFKAVLTEMNTLPPEAHPTFVKLVLLNKEALTARGVSVPEGILIQRSSFGDRRPTLFVVKKFLPEKYHDSWENVNLTCDAVYDDADVSRDAEVAWRPPLPPELQAQLMTRGISLESVDDEDSLQIGAFGGTEVAKSRGG